MDGLVQVVMSTYNGEKYLREQIDSILNQDYPAIQLLVRDDGSKDGTIQILKEYESKYHNFSYYEGSNLGVIRSFFDLLQHIPKEVDYIALSDQDDVWLKEKISVAVKVLQKGESKKPLLYCSNPRLVDGKLKPLPNRLEGLLVKPSFGNAIIENKAQGCTCVMNKELLQLMVGRIPTYTVMHDWWIYLVATCFGEVRYDQTGYILYRQHEENVVGTKASFWDEWIGRIKRFGQNKGKIPRQLRAFIKLYDVEGKQREYIDNVLKYKHSWRSKRKILFDKSVYRQRKLDNLIFKMLFLFNKI